MSTQALTNALVAALTLSSLLLLGCLKNAQNTATADTAAGQFATQTTGQRIIQADKEPHNWLSHDRSYDEQRFSPPDQINDQNAGELGLTWSFDFPTQRGIEATHGMFQAIARAGLRHRQGMVGFGDILEEKDVEALHAYVEERAHVLSKED